MCHFGVTLFMTLWHDILSLKITIIRLSLKAKALQRTER